MRGTDFGHTKIAALNYSECIVTIYGEGFPTNVYVVVNDVKSMNVVVIFSEKHNLL